MHSFFGIEIGGYLSLRYTRGRVLYLIPGRHLTWSIYEVTSNESRILNATFFSHGLKTKFLQLCYTLSYFVSNLLSLFWIKYISQSNYVIMLLGHGNYSILECGLSKSYWIIHDSLVCSYFMILFMRLQSMSPCFNKLTPGKIFKFHGRI